MSMDVALFRELLAPAGQRLLAAIDPSDDPLTAGTRLRRRYPADLVSSAMTQARLRSRARDKFGMAADVMYFTPDGLEQATRTSVATLRTRRLTEGDDAVARTIGDPGDTSRRPADPTGTTRHAAPSHTATEQPRFALDGPVVDLCCGIGGDLLAFAKAGFIVSGVNANPLTAAIAAANIDALGLTERARAWTSDALTVDLAGAGAVFCDPARRTARGRVYDPRAYQPPLATVLDLLRHAPVGCVKVAPGIPHEMVPDGAEAEWVSDHGDVKEAALWFGSGTTPKGALTTAAERTATGSIRRATLLPSGATLTQDTGLGRPLVAAPARYLYEPDGAVVRAHLVAEVAARVDGALLDPLIAYITGDRLIATPYASAFEILEVLPFSLKRLRGVLRERDAGTVTIKKRGSAVDVERLRHELRPRGSGAATVVLTRIKKRPYALVCRPVRH